MSEMEHVLHGSRRRANSGGGKMTEGQKGVVFVHCFMFIVDAYVLILRRTEMYGELFGKAT